jgi:serine/threonine-protein kinase
VVLDEMLSRAFGARTRAPGELTALLDEVTELVRRVVTLRTASYDAQASLERIELAGRERRAQLGFAVDELGIDGSRTKAELRAAREAQSLAESACLDARARFESAHKELVVWEGRSGFLEPWPELAEAYRGVASAVDTWRSAREGERRAQANAEAFERAESDLAFQIRELRASITNQEDELDRERNSCRSIIESNGKTADSIEARLVELLTTFCRPLRSRPELAPLFRELEAQAA